MPEVEDKIKIIFLNEGGIVMGSKENEKGMKGFNMTRREFLKTAGILGAGVVALRTLGLRSPLAYASGPKTTEEKARTVNMLCWEGYDFPDQFQDLKTERNFVISGTYIGNNDEIFTKIKAGGFGTYDVTTPFMWTVTQLMRNDMIEPLDLNKLPNYKELFKLFQDVPWNKKDGKVYSVPFTWGSSVLNYNADEVKKPEKWTDLLKPEWEKKFVIMDDPIGDIIIAGMILGHLKGFSSNMTASQLGEVKDLLLRFKRSALAIVPSFGEIKNILVSGEAYGVFDGWEAVSNWCKAENVNIQHTIPAEGTNTWMDSYAIVRDAPNKDLAYLLCNEVVDAKRQVDEMTFLGSAATNARAVELMPDDMRKTYPYGAMDKYFDIAPPHNIPPSEPGQYMMYEDWVTAWEEVKAG
jgi:spermidine/putrescine transport system substrate-binding protein